jgi:hypothetical protein
LQKEIQRLKIGKNRGDDILNDLQSKGRVFEHLKQRPKKRAEVYLSRSPEKPKFDPPLNPDGGVNSTNEVLK